MPRHQMFKSRNVRGLLRYFRGQSATRLYPMPIMMFQFCHSALFSFHYAIKLRNRLHYLVCVRPGMLLIVVKPHFLLQVVLCGKTFNQVSSAPSSRAPEFCSSNFQQRLIRLVGIGSTGVSSRRLGHIVSSGSCSSCTHSGGKWSIMWLSTYVSGTMVIYYVEYFTCLIELCCCWCPCKKWVVCFRCSVAFFVPCSFTKANVRQWMRRMLWTQYLPTVVGYKWI